MRYLFPETKVVQCFQIQQWRLRVSLQFWWNSKPTNTTSMKSIVSILMIPYHMIHSYWLIHSRLISEAFIPAIVELLEKYAGHTKEIYRKMANGAGICSILFALRENSFVSVQLKSSGLLLLNIDIASEERVCFDYRVNSIKDCSIKSIHWFCSSKQLIDFQKIWKRVEREVIGQYKCGAGSYPQRRCHQWATLSYNIG